MWWAKAGDWSAKAVDQFLGQDAAHKANRTNIMLARENREWMEMMSNSAMQRHMKDLSAAGINPMYGLGTGAGAATPVGQAARVEPTYRPGNMDLQISDTVLKAATAKGLEAQARLTNAEAALKESQYPTSAKTAEANLALLQENLNKVRQEIVEISERTAATVISSENANAMAPLLRRAQVLINEGLAKGLSRKDLEKNVADGLNMPMSKVGEFVDWLGTLGSEAGVAGGDMIERIKQDWRKLKDWFRPENWKE